MPTVTTLHLQIPSSSFHHIASFSVDAGVSHHLPLHQHLNTIELLFVLTGTVHCKINRKSYRAASGTVLVIPATAWHEQVYHAHQTQSGYRLMIESLPSILNAWPSVISLQEVTILQGLFDHWLQEQQSPKADSETVQQHLLQLVITLIYRSAHKAGTVQQLPQENFIHAIQLYMEEHHTQPLTLELLADHFQLNKYQLARLFKQQTGISPIQYVIRCRLHTAKHLLETTNNAVAFIANAVGYKSSTQFQAAFKNATGITPRQHRHEHIVRTKNDEFRK